MPAPAPILRAAELRAVETRLAAQVPTPMERAGLAAAKVACRLATDTGAPVVVVAGPGNNGGDAWVAAAHLRESFHRVIVVDVAGTPPKAAAARAARDAFVARGGEIVHDWPAPGSPALVIDGLFGIGLARDVDAAGAALIARINAAACPVLALDVPSGIDADTGAVRGVAVRATRTLTFLAHKPGLLTGDGLDHRGTLELDALGEAQATAAGASGFTLEADTVRAWLAPRARNVHKGSFGTLGIVGGNRGMVGAALLAARAALHCGPGKVAVGLLAPDAPAVDFLHPELMLRPVDDVIGADVLVVGPGAGQSPSATSVSMFERSVLPAAIASAKPLVLDADALNAIALREPLRAALAQPRKAATLMTPHPGEAGRLLGVTAREVQADRVASALALAARLHAHVVLKGAGSVCASPDGRWSINTTGNAALASGGTGDVLAGLVGALLCQGLDAWRALQYAVCLHGAAADTLVARGRGPVGLTASELIAECRRLLNLWSAGS